MRCLVGFVFVLALVASPLSASAQAAVEESTLSDEPVSDERTLNRDPNPYELRLDSSGVSVSAPSPSHWRDDPRLLKHRQGMIVSSVTFGLGIAGLAGGIVLAHNAEAPPDAWAYIPVGPIVLASFGSAMALAGLVGIAISSSRFSKRKQELRSRAKLERGKRHRVRWDPHISRFVF